MLSRFLIPLALCAFQEPQKPAPAAAEELALVVETLKRPCADGTTLTADLTTLPFGQEDRPIFVCFHMENGSRGEFAEISKIFGEWACASLAVDLRNGKQTGEVQNATAASAAGVHKKTEFTPQETLTDVVDALRWARELRPNAKVFALGSGTSCALVAIAAAREPALADALFLFSPSEDMPGESVAAQARKIQVPTYVTCNGTMQEAARARLIGNAIDKKLRTIVIPTDISGAKRGSMTLVQEDAALRARFWQPVAKLILQLAPIEKAPAEGGGAPQGG